MTLIQAFSIAMWHKNRGHKAYFYMGHTGQWYVIDRYVGSLADEVSMLSASAFIDKYYPVWED